MKGCVGINHRNKMGSASLSSSGLHVDGFMEIIGCIVSGISLIMVRYAGVDRAGN
jgi:hypothetical protein